MSNKNRFWLPALLATAVFSANAFADRGWDDERYEHHHEHCRPRGMVYDDDAPRVIYQAPPVVYQAPPVIYPAPVMYRERIVYRDRPVYYQAEPAYEPRVAYPRYDGNRVVGQAIGALAGGVIGNQFGRGGGRVAATAVGAVVGSMVGNRLADYRY